MKCEWLLLVSAAAMQHVKGDISDQGEVTYRQDGDKNASGAEHTVANGVSVFGRVLDGLIVAVKPSAVRLNGAGLNDQERQAG